MLMTGHFYYSDPTCTTDCIVTVWTSVSQPFSLQGAPKNKIEWKQQQYRSWCCGGFGWIGFRAYAWPASHAMHGMDLVDGNRVFSLPPDNWKNCKNQIRQNKNAVIFCFLTWYTNRFQFDGYVLVTLAIYICHASNPCHARPCEPCISLNSTQPNPQQHQEQYCC